MKLSDFDLDMIRNSRVQINESMLTESDVYKLFVDSSNIKSIWFKDTMNGLGVGSLFVEFNSGSVYEYMRFPEKLYDKFLGAISYGKFFWRFIRGRFPYKRLKIDEID